MWEFGGFHRKRGLRGYVIFLLARSPMNGAELIEQVDRQTRGWWRPSPGSIYPLLEELTRTGVIVKRSDGKYEISSTTRDEFSQFRGWMGPGRSPEELVNELSGYVSYLEELVASQGGDAWKGHRDRIHTLGQRLERILP